MMMMMMTYRTGVVDVGNTH